MRSPGEDVRREGGAARAAGAELVLDLLDEVGHRDAGQRRAARSRPSPSRASCAGAAPSARAPPATSRAAARSRATSPRRARHRAARAPARAPSRPRPLRRRRAGRGAPRLRAASAKSTRPSASSCTTTRARRRLPVEVEVDDHPRQDEERLAPGREERARDPAVRVRDVAEARQVALEPGQVLEVGGRRQEERVEPALLEQRAQPLAPLRILFARNRH